MRVVVTRAREQAAQLVERLEELGVEVAVCPLIEIEAIGPDQVDASGYDWLIVTSANGARELGERLSGRPARVAAIGAGTAAALAREPDLVPRVSTQEGLLAEFPRPPGRVLFAGAEGARRLIVDELGADFVAIYRTRELQPDRFPDGDLVVLTSASAARAYGELKLAIPVVSIGPETSAAAGRAGLAIVSEARTHDLDGVVAAVREAIP